MWNWLPEIRKDLFSLASFVSWVLYHAATVDSSLVFNQAWHASVECYSHINWSLMFFLYPFLQNTCSLTTPAWLILLRVFAFLACAFLVAVALPGSGDMASSISQTLSGGVNPPKRPLQNDSESKAEEGSMMWDDLVGLLPEKAVENARLVWQSGSDHQMAVASVGLLTCITGVLMAGPVRWTNSIIHNLVPEKIHLPICTYFLHIK